MYERLNFVFVGSLIKIKNIDLLILIAKYACSKSCEKRDVRFYIIGDGEERNKIEWKLQREIQAGSVILFGQVSHDKTIELLKNCQVLVLTSFFETLPSVIIEAFASRTVVMTSDYPGVEDLVADGSTGLVFGEESYAAVVDYILSCEFLSNMEYILENASKYFKDNHSRSSVMVSNYENLYMKLMK